MSPLPGDSLICSSSELTVVRWFGTKYSEAKWCESFSASSLGASWGLIHYWSSFLLTDAETFYTETQERVDFNFPSPNSSSLLPLRCCEISTAITPSRMNGSKCYPLSLHLCVMCLYLFRWHLARWKGRGRGGVIAPCHMLRLRLEDSRPDQSICDQTWLTGLLSKTIFANFNLLPNTCFCASWLSLTRSWPHVCSEMLTSSQQLFDLF